MHIAFLFFPFSHDLKTHLQNNIVYLPLKVVCLVYVFILEREIHYQHTYDITHNTERLQVLSLTADVGL